MDKKQKNPVYDTGRPKSALKNIQMTIKEAVMIAAENVGEDGKGRGQLIGYLTYIARTEPKAFTTLLAKILPTELTGSGGQPLNITITRFSDEPK